MRPLCPPFAFSVQVHTAYAVHEPGLERAGLQELLFVWTQAWARFHLTAQGTWGTIVP